MDDLISRQAAIRWVKTECNPYGKPTLEFESGKKVIEHLEQMPSVQLVDKDINVRGSDYIGRRKILVIVSPCIMAPKQAQDLRNRIIDQMKSGLVILPQGYKVITCDTDTVKIKGELENE